MDEKIKELVDFGNYLLSEERDKLTTEECKKHVTHADLMNFIESKSKSL